MKFYIKLLLFTLLIASVSCHKNQINYPPGISTLEATEITATTAVCGGELEYFEPEIDVVGVAWWTEHDTVTSSMYVNIKKGETKFSYEITGLIPNTKYYTDAFVITKYPGQVNTGTIREFTTLAK